MFGRSTCEKRLYFSTVEAKNNDGVGAARWNSETGKITVVLFWFLRKHDNQYYKHCCERHCFIFFLVPGSCSQAGMTFPTAWKTYSLGLVGVEAGDGHCFGTSPWSTGHGRWSLLPKVFTETSVHCWRNEEKNK